MIAKEFCRQTKLHIDEILSVQHFNIDVSKLIEILQATIEFEDDIQTKFDANKLNELKDIEPQIKVDSHGRVEVESGSAKEIAMKYKKGDGGKEHQKSTKKKL